jgi:hypothetical protein
MTTTQNPPADNLPATTDTREALWNGGACGPIQQIQLPTDLITSVLGILFDLDPELYRTSSILPTLPLDPLGFYAAVASQWQSRHPVLAKAEVRNSGTGLHVILRFAEPVIFNSAGERERWAGIVQVVQASLPIDPDQPGITATTRPIGSTNSKNGAIVALLKAGAPVTEQEVRSLYDDMIASSFRTVMKILAGTDRVTPCPICGVQDSCLKALDHVGACYGSCGNAALAELYDLVLRDRKTNHTEVIHDGDDE